MQFRYIYNSPYDIRLESPCKDVFVKLGPGSRELDHFLLHYYGAVIGFSTTTEFERGPNFENDPEDYAVIFQIEYIGNPIHAYDSAGLQTYAQPYLFRDISEQQKIVAIIKDALLGYDASNTKPKRKITVRFSAKLANRLNSGGLLAR